MEIIGFPNYLIHKDGRVWSKIGNGRFLKPATHYKGYLYVHLRANNKPKNLKIHRLIGIHYIPNPNNKSHIDHIDGNKQNNNIDNLRWCSNIENSNGFRKLDSCNTSGHQNISYHKGKKQWRFRKTIFGKKYEYPFKTIEEAIEFKKTFTPIAG